MAIFSFFTKYIQLYQSRFYEDTYWRMRQYCQFRKGWKQYYYLIRLRRVENSMNASTGLGLNTDDSPMCHINGKLILPHRLNNIIIARNVEIGSNVTIYQNVTIAEANKYKKTIIGDNVLIGAGAVILNNVKIGDNAKIGANAVVLKDIPSGATCVGNPGRIILKD